MKIIDATGAEIKPRVYDFRLVNLPPWAPRPTNDFHSVEKQGLAESLTISSRPLDELRLPKHGVELASSQ